MGRLALRAPENMRSLSSGLGADGFPGFIIYSSRTSSISTIPPFGS